MTKAITNKKPKAQFVAPISYESLPPRMKELITKAYDELLFLLDNPKLGTRTKARCLTQIICKTLPSFAFNQSISQSFSHSTAEVKKYITEPTAQAPKAATQGQPNLEDIAAIKAKVEQLRDESTQAKDAEINALKAKLNALESKILVNSEAETTEVAA